MFKVSIDTSKVKQALKREGKKYSDKALDRYLDFIATEIKKEASSNTPVDTGRLKSSLYKVNTGKLEKTVGYKKSRAFYAPFVELGHRAWGRFWVPGKFFLTRAIAKVVNKIRSIEDFHG